MAEIAGLKLIVPSSVAGSGVSVSASGKVTFTAATSVSVNGVFDSTYDNYLIVISNKYNTDQQLFSMRLRASGTDNTTANSYVDQRLQANGATVDAAGGRYTGDQTFINSMGSNQSGCHVYVYGPYLTQPTAGRSVGVSGLSGALIHENAWTHNQSTAYDGFTVFPLAGFGLTTTGSLTIYGLSQ